MNNNKILGVSDLDKFFLALGEYSEYYQRWKSLAQYEAMKKLNVVFSQSFNLTTTSVPVEWIEFDFVRRIQDRVYPFILILKIPGWHQIHVGVLTDYTKDNRSGDYRLSIRFVEWVVIYSNGLIRCGTIFEALALAEKAKRETNE